jgi:hypothetical protein
MNKQESKDFDFVHQYNMDGVQAIGAVLLMKWQQAGSPKTKEEFTPEFKHFWIWITGLIQRLLDAIHLRGPSKK